MTTYQIRAVIIMICFWSVGLYWLTMMFSPQPLILFVDLIVSLLVIERVIMFLAQIEKIFNREKENN